ncbi:4-hydroxy-tetrahydrodipicolinate reductase [Neolewinella aurantiaca]|uniref:4-hydroxy-tetrahydrodipicolinate reductase n=1 Tax=Neolewinella aurantiaca TaxID=2602767 RepID=A0A5C7FIV8_9BACT|nr:4-hydroxy-tetrahydrodipicolinate reductase [Neolewinella aurantiaca]TXF89753.1 4-hydroxy-tetrahydrodipicolinate reductase [Neolewinella aurantiaca]
MKIALFGHGKMGRFIEGLAKTAGDDIVLIVDENNRTSVKATDLAVADVIIEFTRPESAIPNIELALEAGVPIVVGTTGWLAKLPEISDKVDASDGALFWASNFSIGVNVFFEVAARAAALANQYGGYEASVEEIHHVQKLDAPSGTGITLAEEVAAQLDAYDSWALSEVRSDVPQTKIAPASAPKAGKLPVPITSVREPEVPGTHIFELASQVDTLSLKHTAHSREGFAKGALTAARWLVGKRGVFTMKDLLKTKD